MKQPGNARFMFVQRNNITNTRIVCRALLLALLTVTSLAQANHVKCKCPNINARASGSTSCSASESNGQCTVAFNEFDLDLQLGAKDMLQKFGRLKSISFVELAAATGTEPAGFTRKTAKALHSNNPIRVIDQIMIYALVAAVQSDGTKGHEQEAADIHALLRNNAEFISDIFVDGGGRIEDIGITVDLGCFEFNRPGFWGMYKSAWSTSLDNNQC